MCSKVIDYYKNHSVKATLKEFGISYRRLKEICSEYDFIKSKEQIRETYRTTRVEKYGSIEAYREAKESAFNDTIDKKYGDVSLYNFIKYNNIKRTNQKLRGVDNVMQDPKVVEKSIKNRLKENTNDE